MIDSTDRLFNDVRGVPSPLLSSWAGENAEKPGMQTISGVSGKRVEAFLFNGGDNMKRTVKKKNPFDAHPLVYVVTGANMFCRKA